MQTLFNAKAETYEQKWLLLLNNDIALWDVLKSFERKGSLDSAYREVIPNDLKLFLQEHPFVRKVLFNGKKAEAFYKRLIGYYPEGVTFLALPSTSAAYTMQVEEKTRIWGEALLA